MVKKRLKFKKSILNIFKLFILIIFVFLFINLFHYYQVSKISKLGFSKLASENIIKLGKKDIAYKNSNNKTLNAAFESKSFNEKNIKYYIKIKFIDFDNLINFINELIVKGYNSEEINLILMHGSEEDIKKFIKKDKVRYIDEFLTYDFAKLSLYDRYLKYSDETGEDGETTVVHVNLNMDKDKYINPTIVKEFSLDMLVNHRRMLDKNFQPDYLMDLPVEYCTDSGMKASKLAFDAYLEMLNDAKKKNLNFKIHSAYRSYNDQVEISEYFLNVYGQEYVNKFVAKPGFSEHQTGLAFDFKSTSCNIFENSSEYKWLKENSYKYGFIYRFQKSMQNITGYKYEPWHYRYVGKSLAKDIYEKNLSLEEYYVKYLDK